eukprot:scaffold895_cov286-Prasinococcus_capsulatus_cf.AAC.9
MPVACRQGARSESRVPGDGARAASAHAGAAGGRGAQRPARKPRRAALHERRAGRLALATAGYVGRHRPWSR